MSVFAGQSDEVVRALRASFRDGRAGSPIVEAGAEPSAQHIAAAVLVPLVVREELSVLLTRRSEHLHHHPGQICFPGGRIEPDDGSPTIAAIREAEEEVGLRPDRLEILGALPEYYSRTGFRVTPVVALVHPPFELRLDAFEVAESFEPRVLDALRGAQHLGHDGGHPRLAAPLPARRAVRAAATRARCVMLEASSCTATTVRS